MTHSATMGDRKRSVRRGAIWMSLLAFSIYAGFILMGVLRAGH